MLISARAFSALTLLAGRHEGQPACKKHTALFDFVQDYPCVCVGLIIINMTVALWWSGSDTTRSRGVLEKWTLKLLGSPMTPDEVQERIRYGHHCSVVVTIFGNLESWEIFSVSIYAFLLAVTYCSSAMHISLWCVIGMHSTGCSILFSFISACLLAGLLDKFRWLFHKFLDRYVLLCGTIAQILMGICAAFFSQTNVIAAALCWYLLGGIFAEVYWI